SRLSPPARGGSSVTSPLSTTAALPSSVVAATTPDSLTSLASSSESGNSVTVVSARFHMTSALASGLGPDVPTAKSPLMLAATPCSAPSSAGSSSNSPSECQSTGTVPPSSASALPLVLPLSPMLNARASP